MPSETHIGTLQETSLHAALKAWYAQPGDQIEALIDGFWVDIVHGEQLIEIQTGSFSALKRKLSRLLEQRPVRVVYPLPREKTIVRLSGDGNEVLSRRKSPRRGRLEYVFGELVYLAPLAVSANFSLEVLFTVEEELWRASSRGSWRRKGWQIVDRRLLAVLERVVFASPGDYGRLLPLNLPVAFTVRDLAAGLGLQPRLASKMAYCLRQMGVIALAGRRGRAYLYQDPRGGCFGTIDQP
jgi:hypothetical protein